MTSPETKRRQKMSNATECISGECQLKVLSRFFSAILLFHSFSGFPAAASTTYYCSFLSLFLSLFPCSTLTFKSLNFIAFYFLVAELNVDYYALGKYVRMNICYCFLLVIIPSIPRPATARALFYYSPQQNCRGSSCYNIAAYPTSFLHM